MYLIKQLIIIGSKCNPSGKFCISNQGQTRFRILLVKSKVGQPTALTKFCCSLGKILLETSGKLWQAFQIKVSIITCIDETLSPALNSMMPDNNKNVSFTSLNLPTNST